ncbi:ExeA family protein [Sphingomonas sp. RS6]
MYDDHYGLSGRPFQLTPDPRFWFDTATHRKAMAYLGYGLSQGEGFVVITGDPGAGKTTLVGHLLDGIDEDQLNVIRIVSTQVPADDLLRLVSEGLGVDTRALPKASLLSAIERGLHQIARAGRRTLLVIDEAQALPPDSLEELRMLSNFQAGGHALLQIFLLGQPEFRLMLHQPQLEQLRQRVIAMHHLAPMEADEVEPYLIHRLRCVGWQGRPRFTGEALMAMYRWSGGIPRRLNQIASRVLLYGGIERIETFGGVEIAAVIDNFDAAMLAADDAPPRPSSPRQQAEAPPVPPSKPPAADVTALERRIVALEAQLGEQDAALRRVLALLIEWVETGDPQRRPNIGPLREGLA